METFLNSPPASVLLDDSLLFHGTSNISESKFEKDFVAGNPPFSLFDVQKIIAVYDNLRWCGLHAGGYAVLNSFSKVGYSDGERNIYFGETIQRCTLYATHDFAGGELVRSVYYAIKDLLTLVSSTEVQESFKMEYEQDPGNWDRPFDLNLSQLIPRVRELEPLFNIAKNIRESYEYGIVYGLRPKKEDYKNLQFCGSMGIILPRKKSAILPVVKIVYDHDPFIEQQDLMRFERILIWENRTARFGSLSE